MRDEDSSDETLLRVKALAIFRGGEWYPENRGSWKLLIGSKNLGSFCDESQSLIFHVFRSVSESRIFFARSRSLRFAFLADGSDFNIPGHNCVTVNACSHSPTVVLLFLKREKCNLCLTEVRLPQSRTPEVE